MTDSPFEQTKMTIDAFKQLPESSDSPELINGELVASPTPKQTHQDLVLQFTLLLSRLSLEGKIVLFPSDLYLPSDDVLQPDVFWVRADSTDCRIEDDDYWHGVPDLVIEVLSPGTAKRDRTIKYQIYQENGVPEYWISDPYNETIEVYVLHDTSSAYQQHGIYSAEDTFESPSLGKKVDLRPVFSN